jgi:hypothetical protein
MTLSVMKSRFAVALAVAGSTLAFGVVSASAFPGDRVACAFAGAAGPLAPPIPVQGNVTDGSYVFVTLPGAPATCVQATDTEANTPQNADATVNTPFSVRIRAAGYYTNDFVVGNGNVNGTAGLCEDQSLLPPPPPPPVSEFGIGCAAMTAPVVSPPTWYVPQGSATATSNGLANDWTAADYGIDFAGGAGTIIGSAVSPNRGKVPPGGTETNYDGSKNPDAWSVLGAVNITPSPTVPCVPPQSTACVPGFAVTGAFTAES